jgi:GAF domain-containing protein
MYPRALRELCSDVLMEGKQQLALSMGIVSRIEHDDYEIVAVEADVTVFVPGEIFPLRATFCREVYHTCKTIALVEFDGVPGLQRHPLYENLPLEAYISTPILEEGKAWGTLNFSCMKLRLEPFSADDILFIESSAQRLSEAISKLA